jgi:hypothetical protein
MGWVTRTIADHRSTALLATLVAVAGPIAASPRDGFAAGSVPCPPPGAVVLAHGPETRVYSSGRPAVVRACVLGRPGAMTLLPAPSSPGPHRSVGQFRVAGAIVGYIESQFGVDSGSTTLRVADVASRRVLRRIPTGHYVDAGLIFREGATDLLVTARGTVAWISARSARGAQSQLAVHVAAGSGPQRVLDEGPEIDGRSLSLSRGTLSWTDAGRRRSATMP